MSNKSNIALSKVAFVRSRNTAKSLEEVDFLILSEKIEAIASVFSIKFNEDGSLSSENYSGHTHNYTDTTISDTADGSGTASSEDKTTGEVE